MAIGLWVGAAVFLALPVSGGSLNPARTLGPDIVAMQFPYWWIYVAGPLLGGMAGAALWELVLNQGRQPTAGQASGLSHRLPANRPLGRVARRFRLTDGGAHDDHRCHRQTAEAVAPVCGHQAKRFAATMAEAQALLGDHQGTVVAGAWLRDAAVAYVTAGELIAAERLERGNLRS